MTALNLGAERTSDSPLHRAALTGHAAVFQQLLAAAPEAAAATCRHETGMEDDTGWSLMHSAAAGGSVEALQAVLALAPGAASWTTDALDTPLHGACCAGHASAAGLLLRHAPETAAVAAAGGYMPMHCAASYGGTAVVRRLLEAGAPGLDRTTDDGNTPLHLAAAAGARSDEAARLILEAFPAAASMENAEGMRPLDWALSRTYEDGITSEGAARWLLPVSGLATYELLHALAAAGPAAQPLFADLAAQQPLTAAQWQCVPAPCPGLAVALPTVLARSEAEAGQLVRHLPAAEQGRLRLAVLCLARAQHRSHALLPAPLLRAILVQCLVD